MKGQLTIKLKTTLRSDGEKCFGPGVASLLEGIDRHGSLQASAGEMGMAYSKAWTVLRECESALGQPLLTRKAGGAKGGQSQLTPYGRTLLTGYRSMEGRLIRLGEELVSELNAPFVQPIGSGIEGCLNLIYQRLSRDEELALATVTARSGSAPRGAGARMIVGREGRIFGTVGGGLIEGQTELLCARALEEKRGFLQEFSLTADGEDSIGMVCGGSVTVMVQYLTRENTPALTEAMEPCGGDGWLMSRLDENGAGGLEPLSMEDSTKKYPLLGDPTCDKIFFPVEGGHVFAQGLSSGGTVYVFGGGHVARALSSLLAQMDFFHVVMDDREEFTRLEDFPNAKRVICGDFSKLLDDVSPGASDYAVVMTRGHQFDLEVQKELLTTPVGYIGVMGSRKKRDFVFEELRKSGFSDEDLGRIVTPVGLAIGGETPAEIALSIAAQLVQLRGEKERI